MLRDARYQSNRFSSVSSSAPKEHKTRQREKPPSPGGFSFSYGDLAEHILHLFVDEVCGPYWIEPDAIHPAFALILTPLKFAMVTYDKQLAKATIESGIEAISPGI
jgi:hypothetical protein